MAWREPAFYRSVDDLAHFRILVTLRKVSAASRTIDSGAEGAVELRRRATIGAAPAEEEIVEIAWQEKLYSPRELQHYGNANSCVTETDLRHHNAVTALLARGARPQRVFTLVEGEPVPPSVARVDGEVTSPPLPPHTPRVPADRISHTPSSSSTTTTTTTTTTTVTSRGKNAAVTTAPPPPSSQATMTSHPHTLSAHPDPPAATVMHVVADLGHTDHCHSEDEHVLCSIRMHGGVLEVRPDFNNGATPYRIETFFGDVFEYELEHASVLVDEAVRAREASLEKDAELRRAELLRNIVGVEFASPPFPVGALRLHAFGEIVSAEGFEYDNLTVTLTLQISEDWSVLDGTSPVVVTQAATCAPRDGRDIAHFGMPFEFSVSSPRPPPSLAWPRLCVKVTSTDSWGRYRVEGYAYKTIPPQPGMHEWVLNTWRPEGPPVTGPMRRFFLGGGLELEDTAYVANPPVEGSGKILSKLFFRTCSSGSLRLRVSTLHHSHHEKPGPPAHVSSAATTTLLSAVDRARQRLRGSQLVATLRAERGNTLRARESHA